LLTCEADIQSLEFGDVRRSIDDNKDSIRRPPRLTPSVYLLTNVGTLTSK